MIKRFKSMFNLQLTAKSPKDVLIPVIYLCRLVGIAPYTYIAEEGISKTVFHYPSLMWSLFIHMSYIISTVTVIINGESITNLFKFSPFFKYGDIFRIQMGLCCILFLSISSIFQRNKYSEVLEMLNVIHFLFGAMKTHMNYSKIKTRIVVAMSTSVLFHLFYLSINVLLINWSMNFPSWSLVMSLYFPTVVSIFTYTILNSLNLITINCFSVLNAEIKKIMKKRISSSETNKAIEAKKIFRFNTTPSNDSQIMEKIGLCWKVYDKICDTCDCANEIFSIKILFILSGSFVLFVFNEYQVLSTIPNVNIKDEQYPVMFFSMHQAILSSGISIVMIVLCNRCKEMVGILLKHISIFSLFCSHNI